MEDLKREFWLVGDDPASIDDNVFGMRFFSNGTKPVTPSSIRAEGERVSEADWSARVAARRAAIAAKAAPNAGK